MIKYILCILLGVMSTLGFSQGKVRALHSIHKHHLIRDVDSTTPGNKAFGVSIGADEDDQSLGMGYAIQLPIRTHKLFASYVSEAIQYNMSTDLMGSIECGRWSTKSSWTYGLGFDAVANIHQQIANYWLSFKPYYNFYTTPTSSFFADISPKYELGGTTIDHFLLEYGLSGTTRLQGIHLYLGYALIAQTSKDKPFLFGCSLSISYTK